MFNPSREQVRLFFLNTWKKYHQQVPLSQAESLSLQWMSRHPEYFAVFEDSTDTVLQRDYQPEDQETNPFLHLSMHLAIAEQISIDQPPGIHAAFAALCQKYQDEHSAAHAVFDCLAEQIYQQQRNGLAFSGERYLASIQALVSKPLS
jgi:hypothetical protein